MIGKYCPRHRGCVSGLLRGAFNRFPCPAIKGYMRQGREKDLVAQGLYVFFVHTGSIVIFFQIFQ
jgi:hypothetical protein